jgi:hypothetical protein
VVNTLNKLTPMKQQQVLTSLKAKLVAQQDTPQSESQVTHPLHEWLLPADDPQIAPRPVPNTLPEQRVPLTQTEQRVPMLRRITDAPPIMVAPNPTSKRLLKRTPRTHVRLTRNNTPGSVPAITRSAPRRPNPLDPPPTTAPRRSPRIPKVKFAAIPGGLRGRNLISQEAVNFITDCVWSQSPDIFTPKKLKPAHSPSCLDLEQVAMPMVHPTTGETISSYKKLMHDPATKEIWQTAFGKDFGGMAQGCNKTGQKGTNAIFVMTHEEIRNIPKD